MEQAASQESERRASLVNPGETEMGRCLSSGLDAPDHYGSGDFDLSESPQNFMMQPTFPGEKPERESARQKAANAAKASLRTPEEPKAALKV